MIALPYVEQRCETYGQNIKYDCTVDKYSKFIWALGDPKTDNGIW